MAITQTTRVPDSGAMRLLHDLSQLVARKERLDEVLNFVFENFGGLVPYDCIGYSFVDYNHERVVGRWERCHGKVPINPGYVSPLHGSTLQAVIETGKPLILNDLQDHLKKHGHSQSTRLLIEQGMRASLTCPLLVHDRPVGFLFFCSRTPYAYQPSSAEVIEEIADHLAWLIERSQLAEHVRLAKERAAAEAEQRESIERSTSRLRKEVADVRDCQRNLFPLALPTPQGYRLAVWTTPGYENGSSFLDVISLPGGRSAFIAVDCGIGGQTGIVLKTVLHTAARLNHWERGSAGEILERLNDAVQTCFPQGTFASAMVAVFDPRSGAIDWTDAGFSPPIVLKYAGYAVDGGPLSGSCRLGNMASQQWLQDQSPLMAGDKFILYTDQLLKLKSAQGEEFGLDRFHEGLKRAARKSAEGTLQMLSQEIGRFQGGSADDESILVFVIERHPDNVECRAAPEATGFPDRTEKLQRIAGVTSAHCEVALPF